MAKVTLNHMFASLSGKLCKKQSTYIALGKKNGKMYSAEYHERDYPNTEKQQAVKAKFTSKAQAASTWWKANKPLVDAQGTTTREATDDFKVVMEKFDAQSKYNNAYSYFRSLVSDDLKVKIGTKTLTLGSGTPTTPTDNADQSNPSQSDTTNRDEV